MTPLTSLLIVGLAFGTTICAEKCTQNMLQTLTSSSYLKGCTSEVGFGSISNISVLTDKQIKAICDNSDCMALLDEARAIVVDDCTFPGTTIALKKDILDPFDKACSNTSGSVDLASSSAGETAVGSTASGSTSGSSTIVPVSSVSAVVLVVAALALQ